MSPSFRNLFSSGDGNARSSSDGGGQGASGVSNGQVFLISEILPYIPPAIVARSGIPMDLSVSIPLPADGSREVRLSVLHHLCPALFAAEITPMNDLAITLPPRIGVKAQTVAPQDNLRERPLFQKSSVSPAAPAATAGPSPNPFRPRRIETGAGNSRSETLFSRKAAEDADLPAPHAPASAGGEMQATWGSLFLDKARPTEAKTEIPQAVPVIAKSEPVPPAPLEKHAELPPLVPVMAKPQNTPLASASAKSDAPPLAPVKVNPPAPAPSAAAKIPSHVFESLEEEDDEIVKPVPAFAPNPWASIEALRPVPFNETKAGAAASKSTSQGPKQVERGLIFRAIFGTDDDFDLDRLAQCLLDQAGIDSVVLSFPPHLAEATAEASEKLGDKALELIETTRSLGRLVGMDHNTFSFQADHGYISLFTHGEQAIVVRHVEARLSPGLRERLLLSVRNLESLV